MCPMKLANSECQCGSKATESAQRQSRTFQGTWQAGREALSPHREAWILEDEAELLSAVASKI